MGAQSHRLLLLAITLVSLGADAPTTQPTTNPADRAPEFFVFEYPHDKDNKHREWTRTSETTWTEDDGKRKTKYELVPNTPFDPKDPGIVVTRLPHRDMEVFIPTLDNKDKRLGWRYPKGKEPKNAPPKGEGFDWYTLGTISEWE